MGHIKIAVLDTGLDIDDEEIKEFCKFDESLQIRNMGKYIDDFNGHGTFVCKTITNMCKNIEVYPIKIFNEWGRTSSLDVVIALRKILNSNIDIINISASTFDHRYKNELHDICDKLKLANKIVICSKHNSDQSDNSIPATFNSVIGVKGHEKIYLNNQYVYRKEEKVQMLANGKESFIKFKGKVTHFGENSRACAVATGIIANILSDNKGISFNQLEKILIERSLVEKILYECDLTDRKIFYEQFDNKVIYNIKKEVLKIINCNFSVSEINLEFIQRYGIMNSITKIGMYNAYDFLEKINDYFKININYKDVFIFNLMDIENLASLVLSYLKLNIRGVNKNEK